MPQSSVHRHSFWEFTTHAAVVPPPVPLGKIKSFGAFGPKYEVGPLLRQLEDGDWMVQVKMVADQREQELDAGTADAVPLELVAARLEARFPG